MCQYCTFSKQFDIILKGKELSLCHKLKFSNPYIFAILKCISLIFQTQIISSNIIHSLKYLRSTTISCKDIGIRKSEFVAKTQFLSAFSIHLVFLVRENTKYCTINQSLFKRFVINVKYMSIVKKQKKSRKNFLHPGI